MNISIIIPTYREHTSIARLLKQIFRVLPLANVVVVDDSPDNRTQIVIKKFQLRNKRIHLIRRDKKGGRGSAVIDGMRYALDLSLRAPKGRGNPKRNLKIASPYERTRNDKWETDVFIEMDADGSHDPKELLAGITEVRTKKVVVSSRYTRGSSIVDWPLSRRILSRLSNTLIRILLHSPLRDNTNGFRFYSTEAARILYSHQFVTTGFIVLSEEMFVLRAAGFAFTEIPTVFRNRTRGSSSANWNEFFASLRALWRLKRFTVPRPKV